MKYVIGIAIGVMLYHYYPSEVQGVAAKTGEIIHQGATKAAEVTAPKSEFEKFTENFK